MTVNVKVEVFGLHLLVLAMGADVLDGTIEALGQRRIAFARLSEHRV